jgi:hypothetical protein
LFGLTTLFLFLDYKSIELDMLEFNVLITSFFNARKYELENKFGVACWKPDWCKHNDLEFLFPKDKNLNRLRLRNFNGSILAYVDSLREGYESRWNEIEQWLESLKKDQQYILCCWCPNSSTAKEQIKEFGTFFCHTALIGKMIRIHRPDLIVKLDYMRETKSVPETIDWYNIKLEKIISGGQTGADQAGLFAAKKLNLKTGGWMPKGFRTLEGPNFELSSLYGLQEHKSYYYSPRTYQNVKESDGTVRFATNFESSGEICTMKAIVQYDRPFFDIDLTLEDLESKIVDFKSWLKCYSITTLNVAGNSESTSPGISQKTVNFLVKALRK